MFNFVDNRRRLVHVFLYSVYALCYERMVNKRTYLKYL
jgi:hypothetical protein